MAIVCVAATEISGYAGLVTVLLLVNNVSESDGQSTDVRSPMPKIPLNGMLLCYFGVYGRGDEIGTFVLVTIKICLPSRSPDYE